MRERIARAKYLTPDKLAEFDAIASEIETQLVANGGAHVAPMAEGGER